MYTNDEWWILTILCIWILNFKHAIICDFVHRTELYWTGLFVCKCKLYLTVTLFHFPIPFLTCSVFLRCVFVYFFFTESSTHYLHKMKICTWKIHKFKQFVCCGFFFFRKARDEYKRFMTVWYFIKFKNYKFSSTVVFLFYFTFTKGTTTKKNQFSLICSFVLQIKFSDI